MKEIKLTQSKVALVDDGDYKMISKYLWYSHKNGRCYYAKTNILDENGDRSHIDMHRLILGLKPGDGKMTDHKNNNGLDNRKSNLRTCSYSQNNYNSRPSKGCSSKYKGVSWNKKNKRWHVSIRLNGKSKHLGTFKDEIEAAKAYDNKVRELHGEFAYLNFKENK